MKKNIGTTDKSIRVIVAIVIAVLYYTGTISGTLGIVLLVLAGILLLTILVNYCPLYPILGINSRKKN